MSKNYVDLKVSELRDECKNRNLDTSGLKVHLVERLNKYDREQTIKSKTDSKPQQSSNANSSDNFVSKLLEESKRNSSSNKTGEKESNNEENKSHGAKEDRKRPHASPGEDGAQSSSGGSGGESLLAQARVERDLWDSRTDVHLDYYNSDMNLVIDAAGTSATPLHEDGFQYACAGARATYGIGRGRAFFETTVGRKFPVELVDEVGEKSFIRIGWSVDNGVLSLGETRHSFGFDCGGKVMTSGHESEYGAVCAEGDVVGCFLEFNEDCFLIRYSINGVDQGEAFNVLNRDLNGSVLFPHIYVKNTSFEVNFGQNGNAARFPPTLSADDEDWRLIGHLSEDQRIRAMLPPKSKSECEVLMMCGLPSCGKTHWTEQHIRDHPEKRYNVLSINTVLEKMKVANLRKKVSSSRWDSFILSATQCLNKLIEIAVSRKRNFILDQTNVYPTAQRRRMKPFEEFIRKAIIIVPADDEYQRRMNQVIQEEGKDVPESAVLQMKENFVIPEEGSDLFNEIIFIELQRFQAEELIKKYNEEAKNHKKKESLSDNKGKREKDEDEEGEDFGKWASTSPKAAKEDSEPSAPKKSRWNTQPETKKRSKSKERSYDRGSSDRGSSDRKKNDYKGGFCFSREASDSGRGGSSGFRSDNSRHDKSRDQRNDRSGSGPNKSGYSSSGSGSGSYRRGGDSGDRKPRFDTNSSREESRFGGGNRSQMGGTSGGNNRDSRPRDRGNDPRGGSQFNQGNRDRSRGGGFGDRRGGNLYDEGDSRADSKFAQSTVGVYGDHGSNYPSSNNPDRTSRFGSAFGGGSQNTMSTDRSDFRGRGRGSGGIGGGSKDSFNDRSRDMGAQEQREFPNYSDFTFPSSFQDNRYGSGGSNNSSSNNAMANQMPWQQSSDYSNKPSDPRLAHGAAAGAGGYDNRGANQGGSYDNYQYGGGVGGGQRGSGGNRGGKMGAPMNDMQGGNSNSYYNTNSSGGGNERKPQNMRGGMGAAGGASMNRGAGRGGHPASSMDNYSNDDYSYGGSGGMNKSSYETGGGAPMQKYKQQQQQGGASYSDSGMMGGGNSGSGSGYKDYSRPDMNYSSAGGAGGNKPQSRQGGYMGGQASDTSGGMKKTDYSSSRDAYSDSYDDYQASYDNSQYGQNSGYYNYYSGTDSGSKADSQQQQQQQTSSYQQPSSNRVAGYQSYVSGSSGATGGGYSSTGGGYSSTGGAYQSSTTTGGYGSGSGYQQPQAASYPASSSSSYQATSYSNTGASTGGQTGAGYQYQTSTAPAAASVNPYHQSGQYQSSGATLSGSGSQATAAAPNHSATTAYTNPYTAMYAENATSSYSNSYYGQSNTYSQSTGTYGDTSANTAGVQSKYTDYSSKAPSAPAQGASATMLPPTSAGGVTGQAQSAAAVSSGQQNTANWNTSSYGDYSQYYGQYYGQ